MTTLSEDLVCDALDAAGLDADLVRSYSGRGMYGTDCLGLFGTLGDAMKFVASVAVIEGEVPDWTDLIATDSMGLGIVVYFPGVLVPEGWDG